MGKVFQCLRCDKCCYFYHEYESPIVFPHERRLLEEKARELDLDLSELVFEPYEVYRVDREDLYIIVAYRWVIRGYCPFYDREHRRCMIHKVKPLSCKMFPLILNITCNAVHVSEACTWVRNNLNYVLSSNPTDVFRDEIKALLEAYILFFNHLNTIKMKYGEYRKVEPDDIKQDKLLEVDKIEL